MELLLLVNPRVIPYGTKLYIPGYGEAIAGDTGGGSFLVDLWFPSKAECNAWGRKYMTVYILN